MKISNRIDYLEKRWPIATRVAVIIILITILCIGALGIVSGILFLRIIGGVLVMSVVTLFSLSVIIWEACGSSQGCLLAPWERN